MTIRKIAGPIALAAMAFLLGSTWTPAASAASITFVTPSGSTLNSLPVNAQADFTTSANTLTIVLTNLQSNPTSVVQNLSDLSFNVAGGPSSGTLTSSSGLERTVNSDGTFTDGSTVSTGWALTNSGTEYTVSLLGTPTAPEHTIIGGPGAGDVYSNANNSITGTSHNPFLANSATFTLTLTGITAATTINNVTFSFNSDPGFDVTGVPSVPEPASVVTLGLGVGAIGLAGLRRRASKRAA